MGVQQNDYVALEGYFVRITKRLTRVIAIVNFLRQNPSSKRGKTLANVTLTLKCGIIMSVLSKF